MAPYFFVTPVCCRQAYDARTVVLNVHAGWESLPEYSPKWVLLAAPPHERGLRADEIVSLSAAYPSPVFCPYCGVRLPLVERRAPLDASVHAPSESGDSCTTCGTSAWECYCLPAEALWQPVGGDGRDPDLMYRVRKDDEETNRA